MTTAVDTNILLDVLIPNPKWEESSRSAIGRAVDEGGAIVGETVFAELSAAFRSPALVQEFLADLGIAYVQSNRIALFRAGSAWGRYSTRRPKGVTCPRCGNRTMLFCSGCGEAIASRQHLIADFVVGAHAFTHADRLLTRDLGFYGTYFPDLTLI